MPFRKRCVGLEKKNFQDAEKGIDEIHPSHILATDMNALTKTERIALLEKWLEEFKRVEFVNEALVGLFSSNPAGVVHACYYELFAKYSLLVSEKVGDDGGWLEWFIWENDCGKKAMEAKAKSWKKARKIRTVKDLEAIISAK